MTILNKIFGGVSSEKQRQKELDRALVAEFSKKRAEIDAQTCLGLIAEGANPNAYAGAAAILNIALGYKFYDVAEKLVAAGADPQRANRFSGNNAYDIVATFKDKAGEKAIENGLLARKLQSIDKAAHKGLKKTVKTAPVPVFKKTPFGTKNGD